MKNLVRAGAVVVAVLALSGCSSIDSGYITKKVYEPGFYYTTQTCASYNSEGSCAVWVPITNYDDPDWRFDIAKKDDKGWVYVSENEYAQYEVGEFYPRSK